MGRLIFLLEERSAALLLEALLPRLFPELTFRCLPHEGKSDLKKSLRAKLQNWQTPGDQFVVIQDQDSADCVTVKQYLSEICASAGRPDTLVRIACRELEAWYFGEPAAMARAFAAPRLAKLSQRKPYRVADAIVNPARELEKLHPSYQKLDGARLMGGQLSYAGNASSSFRALIEGVARISGHALPG